MNKNPLSASANVSATLSMSAIRSQAFLLTLLGLAAISLIAAFMLLASNNSLYWVPFIPAGICVLVGTWLWFLSFRSSELDGAHPVKITKTDKEINVFTDPRILESRAAMSSISQILAQVGNRELLPPPKGLVDDKGQLIPNSHEEAKNRIDSINAQTLQILKETGAMLCGQTTSKTEVQSNLPEPENIDMIRLNQPLDE